MRAQYSASHEEGVGPVPKSEQSVSMDASLTLKLAILVK
jgi:hypothetical protein